MREFLLKTLPPSLRPRQSEQEKTDRALRELRKHRERAETIPEIHIHNHAPKRSKGPEPGPKWVKIAVAFGVPAILLEVARRFLQ